MVEHRAHVPQYTKKSLDGDGAKVGCIGGSALSFQCDFSHLNEITMKTEIEIRWKTTLTKQIRFLRASMIS
jgi:hypothetical protein